jgi:hypothetical protein
MTLNLEQFSRLVGGTTSADVLGHIHAGLRSAPQTKTHKRFMERRYHELQEAVAATKEAYEQGIVEGRILRPRPLTLEERASGHPDNPSVQAARRILERRRQNAGTPPAATGSNS